MKLRLHNVTHDSTKKLQRLQHHILPKSAFFFGTNQARVLPATAIEITRDEVFVHRTNLAFLISAGAAELRWEDQRPCTIEEALEGMPDAPPQAPAPPAPPASTLPPPPAPQSTEDLAKELAALDAKEQADKAAAVGAEGITAAEDERILKEIEAEQAKVPVTRDDVVEQQKAAENAVATDLTKAFDEPGDKGADKKKKAGK